MRTTTPRDLFFDQLRDIHSAETQLAESLPTLLARRPHPPLAGLIARHADETRRQLDIVTSIFKTRGVEIGGDPCRAMEGLIAGGDAHLDAVKSDGTRDLMMIAHCLRIEHYEIAAYQITLTLAEQLGLAQEAALLAALLDEERAAAAALEKLQPSLFERAVEPIVA